jgi:hypothetical protein
MTGNRQLLYSLITTRLTETADTMDEYVIRAMARWPDVPAVYGWLGLDRRGDWRIKGERLAHRKAVAFVNRNYAADDSGCWFFQNGPQRVYVRLEYTPWIYSLGADDELYTHTEVAVEEIDGVYLDDHGNLLLDTARGIGLVDDRDLDAFSARLDLDSGGAGAVQLEAAIAEMQSGRRSGLLLRWRGRALRVGPVARSSVPSRFGFHPDPAGQSDRS